MRQIVHLKLSGDYPPEVQEAAILREDSGECLALVKIRRPGGVVEMMAPLVPCGEMDPEAALSPDEARLVELANQPAYQRLMDDLKRLSRSME